VPKFDWSPQRECFHCGGSTEGAGRYYCSVCKSEQVLRSNEAVKVVGSMVANGILPSPQELDCADCGKTAEHYDHRDYAEPEKVEPVCRACNCSRGPARISGFTRPDIPKGWRRRMAAL